MLRFFYIENPKEPTDNFLELIGKFTSWIFLNSKHESHIAFLNISNLNLQNMIF